ncbi:hypothetical protein WA026_012882 [Henosepilachna vigintioctopunctata]|uniref:Uncharacterized protein n=1 Tax=Henosepilachna vigintioctopunctata TaxID=420089 RepID=A0AAW1TK32_9CUCU
MSRRKLSQKEMQRLAENLSEVDSESEPDIFENSSDEYEPDSDVDDTSKDESSEGRNEAQILQIRIMTRKDKMIRIVHQRSKNKGQMHSFFGVILTILSNLFEIFLKIVLAKFLLI